MLAGANGGVVASEQTHPLHPGTTSLVGIFGNKPGSNKQRKTTPGTIIIGPAKFGEANKQGIFIYAAHCQQAHRDEALV